MWNDPIENCVIVEKMSTENLDESSKAEHSSKLLRNGGVEDVGDDVVVVDTNEIRNHSLHQLLSLWIIYNILSACWLALLSALMFDFDRSRNSYSKPISLNESMRCARASMQTADDSFYYSPGIWQSSTCSTLKCSNECQIKWIEKEEAKWRKQQWNHVWCFWWAETPAAHTHTPTQRATASKPIDRRRANNLSPDKLWHFVCLCFGSSLSASTSITAMNFRWICILAIIMWCECTTSSVLTLIRERLEPRICPHTLSACYRPIVASRPKPKTKNDKNEHHPRRLRHRWHRNEFHLFVSCFLIFACSRIQVDILWLVLFRE